MQVYTQGKDIVEAEGRTVRKLLIALDETYPGLKAALVDGDKLKPGIAVAVDGQISHLGLLQPLTDENEVFFVPAIGGGEHEAGGNRRIPKNGW